MGMARNASSGDKGQSRWKARDKAASEKGIPVPGTGGHHSWRFRWGSNRRNMAGGINAVLHYSDSPKWDAAEHNLNNAATRETIAEQVADAYEDEWSPAVVLLPEPSRHEIGYDYDLEDLPEGVTFNGQPAEYYASETEWDPYCWCTECNLGRDRDGLRGQLAAAQAEIIILRSENATLNARINFLEERHEYR